MSSTELVFVMDRSGSMCGLEADTIGGFNAVLKEHQQAEGECFVTTVLFSNESETLHDRLPIAEVPLMTASDYRVGGCTALLDAMGTTIKHIGKVQGYLPAHHKPDKTIVVVTTDGMENASHKYRYADVKRLVSQKEEQGWEFLFLGANIDATAEAARLGIAEDRAVEYVCDEEGTELMFAAVASASASMRDCCGGRVDGSWADKIRRDTAARGHKR